MICLHSIVLQEIDLDKKKKLATKNAAKSEINFEKVLPKVN